ncbi:multidrug resistance protein MdtG [Halalkalicoccus paucihalophilus]|uniref:Multidrug resistance protein MdtG n=1 Tax=Halalkalicoccus paucihalophilus TaxID=1008153 RepID=A0A151ABD2_9EURY|nr:MFS transporter [Halalkalicoccus paucihalophilus]KYH24991.1 multidrug resistance protein MdtG [Halalkalicoccus paucihalophilus]
MTWQYKHTVLTLCTFAFFATMVARLAISPVVPAITDDFQIGNTVIGIALTGMWLSYAIMQFPSGILADRFGERSIILVSVGGTTVMSILLALSPVYAVFVLAMVVLGAVAGLHYSAATTLLSRTYDNLGFAIGVHTIGSSAAGLVAPIAAAWISIQYGWRPAVAFGSIVAAPIFALFVWRIHPVDPHRPEQPLRQRFQLEEVTNILSKPEIAFTVAIASVGAFVWQGTASFLPTFLVEHRGQSATLSGIVFSAYFVIQSIVKPGIGAVSDRFGRDVTTFGCMVTSAAGLGLFVTVRGVLGIAGGLVLIGNGLSWAVAVEPRFMDNMTNEERGAGFGLVRTVYLVVGSFGSVVVGLFADIYGWGTSFGMLIVLLLLVAIALTVNWLLDLGY